MQLEQINCQKASNHIILPCPICSDDGRPIGAKDGAVIRYCDCGVLMSFPWASVKEYESWYTTADLYHSAESININHCDYWKRDAEYMRADKRRLDTLTALYPPNKYHSICDVGAGTGTFISMAVAYGYMGIGFEPNVTMCKKAEELGRPLIPGDLYSLGCKYHIITLFDVWEHLVKPIEALEFLGDHLEPGGIIVIELPEYGCPQSIEMGLKWKHIKPKQHIFLPNDRACRKMFRTAKLEVLAAIRPMWGSLGKITYYLTPKGIITLK